MSLTKPATCCFICCSTASRDIPANRETKNRQAYRLKTSPQIPLKLGRQGAIQFDKLIPILKKVALSENININMKETWLIYRTIIVKRKTYMSCLVNKKVHIVIFFFYKDTEDKNAKHSGRKETYW